MQDKKTVNFVFFVILMLNLLSNIDHGTLPAGSVDIKTDLDLNNLLYGLLGSVVFIGLTFGKFLANFV
jgi:hypothetical protein